MIKKILYILLFIFLIPFFGLIYLTTTHGGLKLSLALAAKATHHQLSYGKTSGSLIRSFSIDDFNYENGNHIIKIEHLDLAWWPLALFSGRIYINHLTLNHSIIHLAAEEKTTVKKDTSLKSLIKLPIAFSLHNIQINDLTWKGNANPIKIEKGRFDLYSEKNSIHITQFLLESGPHTIDIKGYLNLSSPYDISLQAALKTQNINLTETTAALTGSMKNKYQLTLKSFQNKRQQLMLDGILDRPLTTGILNVKGQWNNFQLPLSNTAKFQSQQGKLSLIGNLSNYRLNFNTDFKTPSLPKTSLQISGAGSTSHIAFNKINISAFKGNIFGKADLAWQPQLTWNGELNIKQLNTGLITPKWPGRVTMKINSSGTLDHFKLQIRNLTGDLKFRQLSGKLNLDVNKNRYNFNDSDLNLGKSHIKLNGAIGNTWNVSWETYLDDLSLLSPILKGKMNSQGKITGQLNTPLINAKAEFYELLYNSHFIGSIQTDIISEKNKNSQPDYKANIIFHNDRELHWIPKILLHAFTTNDGSKITINAQTKPTASTLQLLLPKYFLAGIPKRNQKLEGSAKLNWQDLSPLSSFIPDIQNMQGALTGDLDFSGTLHQPKITGELKATNGRLKIKAANLELSKINLSLKANTSNLFKLNGAVYSQENPLTLTGKLNMNQHGFPFDLQAKGNNLLVYNTNEYKVFASPDLKLNYQAPKMTLTGNIVIPKAQIEPKDFSSSVTLPGDVKIISDKEKKASTNDLQFFLNNHITLGDNIDIQTLGLKAKLTGNLTLNLAPQQLATAKGKLEIKKGSYKAFGTALKISKGELIYTGGPIEDPGLNITAIKFIKNIQTGGQTASASFQQLIVGIDITGSIKNPRMNFFSSPAGLTQSDILSYLLFGVPSGQTTGGQAQLLMAAIESTSVGGNVANEIKQTFGLSDFGFESTNVFEAGNPEAKQNTSFVLGKYLTPKIYIGYSVGLIIPINVFTARYILNRNWMLETNSSTLDTGGDIFYTLDV